jgi:Tfp pilus assembly protein PilO
MNIKVIQGATVVFFAITAYLIWQITDIYPQIATLQEDIKTQEADIKDSEDTLKRLKELVAFAAENKESIKKFDLILPGDEEKATLLSNLDNLANANGLSTLKISFDAVSPSAGVVTAADGSVVPATSDYDSRNVRISLRGSYLSFKNFLTAIENNLRVVDITSVDFTPETSSKETEGEGGRKSYTYSIGLKAYLQAPTKGNDIFKLLNAGKFKNFNAKQLGFTKEKVFSELPPYSDYNVNAGVGEIGNPDMY